MVNFLENMGLGFFRESEKMVRELFACVTSEGHPIMGYSGNLYICRNFGDAKVSARVQMCEGSKTLEMMGADTHCEGGCLWTCRVACADPQPEDADVLERRCMLQKQDGSGMAIVDIVHGDVLPSFLPEDELVLQMVGFPAQIDYYADEDAYADSVPAEKNGRKMLLGTGAVLPNGFLRNHDPDVPEGKKNYEMDDYVLLSGIVEKITNGKLQMGEEEPQNVFLKTTISTQFGALELVHDWSKVKEAQRDNLRPGALVVALCVLAGDAAIGDYAKGAIFDLEHDLRLLRYAFVKNSTERLSLALAEDCTYCDAQGKAAVLLALQALCAKEEGEHFADMGYITTFDGDPQERMAECGALTRCVMLAVGEQSKYCCALLAETNERGRISRISKITDSRYHFRPDEAPQRTQPERGEPPKAATEAMLMRAKYASLIINDTQEVSTDCPRREEFRQRAAEMIAAFAQSSAAEKKEGLKNIFGYLFAKEYEKYRHDKRLLKLISKPVRYWPQNAICNLLNTDLNDGEQVKARGEMERGKQFFKDFDSFARSNELAGAAYDAELMQALILVQRLGELNAPLVDR